MFVALPLDNCHATSEYILLLTSTLPTNCNGICRDVLLNVRLTTERAVALGVDCHICELQLILLVVAKLKVELIRSQ